MHDIQSAFSSQSLSCLSALDLRLPVSVAGWLEEVQGRCAQELALELDTYYLAHDGLVLTRMCVQHT